MFILFVQTLLIPARFRLRLDRGVMNGKFGFEQFGQCTAGAFGLAAIGYRDMSGQARVVARDRPQMKVMDAGYAIHRTHRHANFVEVEPARDAL